MSRILNEVYTDKIKPDKARVLIYGCSTLAAIVKDGELEQRLSKIEKKIKENNF